MYETVLRTMCFMKNPECFSNLPSKHWCLDASKAPMANTFLFYDPTILFIGSLLNQLLDWTNRSIRMLLNDLHLIITCWILQYFAIKICSHSSGLSSKTKIQVLPDCGWKVPWVEKIRRIPYQVLVTHATGRGNSGVLKFQSQCGYTRSLSVFEAVTSKGDT